MKCWLSGSQNVKNADCAATVQLACSVLKKAPKLTVCFNYSVTWYTWMHNSQPLTNRNWKSLKQ